MKIDCQAVPAEDRGWMTEFFIQHWGSQQMVYSQGVHECDQLPAVAAYVDGQLGGLITYQIKQDECEIVSLDSLLEGRGIGTALVQDVVHIAKENGCRRVWLITTNDNLNALRFYQKRKFEFVAVYRNAVEKARKIKPEIPLIGDEGIPIRDEIELELLIRK